MEHRRILVLCHEFPPLGGGAGKNLFLLCRELSSQGWKIKVWTVDPGLEKREQFNFDVEYFDVGRKTRFDTNIFGMLRYLLKIRFHFMGPGLKSLNEWKPNFVFSVLGIPAGIAGSWISKTMNIPHFLWYHGSDIHGGQIRGPGKFHRLLLRHIWKNAAMIFFVSPSLRDKALKLKEINLPMILPSTPSPEILNYSMDKILPLSERYFLFLGRFDAVKQPLLFVQAVTILKELGQGKNTLGFSRKIIMVGSGKLHEEIVAAIKFHNLEEVISLRPAVSFEQIPELLNNAYALIIPSRIEGFNTTVLEAAHFSVPTIAANVPGLNDFILHQETGILFEDNNAESLAYWMQTLSDNPALVESLGRNCEIAAKPFHIHAIAQIFQEKVDTFLGENLSTLSKAL